MPHFVRTPASTGCGFGAGVTRSGLILLPKTFTGMNANIRTAGGSIVAALMAGVVTADLRPDNLPNDAGYTNGLEMLCVALVVAAFPVLLMPRTGPGPPPSPNGPAGAEPETGTIASGQPGAAQ